MENEQMKKNQKDSDPKTSDLKGREKHQDKRESSNHRMESNRRVDGRSDNGSEHASDKKTPASRA